MRIKGSYILAALMAAGIAGWMLSGEFVIGGQADRAGEAAAPAGAGAPAKDRQEKQPFRVQVSTLSASQRVAELVVRGRTEAEARVQIKAETTGLVEAMPFAKGSQVKTGDVVCRIEVGAREIKVARARAEVAKAELEFEAANRLSEKQYASETRVRTNKAALDAAKAMLADAELELKRTKLRAPFDGVIEEENAEIGSYLNTGTACVTISARDPLLVVGQVSERDVAALDEGMTGHATLITGEEIEGKIRFIAPSSDPATRTFRVELEVPNPGNRLRDGVTAQMRIALEPVSAHNMPSSYLTLDDRGRVGVRSVTEANVARFIPVKIIGDSSEGVWITGLPDTVTVITVGQDYVTDGETVEPVARTADKS